ncbi:hypothetical protein ACO0QE_004784 [Hanseniaspora vineae]
MVEGIVRRCDSFSTSILGKANNRAADEKPTSSYIRSNGTDVSNTIKKKSPITSDSLHRDPPPPIIKVVAVDMGIANFSYSKFDVYLFKQNTNKECINKANGFERSDMEMRTVDKNCKATVVHSKLTEWAKYDLANKYANILNPNYPDPYCCRKPSKTAANSKYIQFNPQAVNNLCDELVKMLFPKLPNTGSTQPPSPSTIVLLEHQRTRTGSSSNVLETVYRNSVIEYVLFGKLTQLFENKGTSRNAQIQSSDARKMCDFWVKDEKKLKKKTSKNPRLQLCYSMFDSLISDDTTATTFDDITTKAERLRISEDVYKSRPQFFSASSCLSTRHPQLFQRQQLGMKSNKGRFFNALGMSTHDNGTVKDDDLCDSLLHGLAWIKWFEFYNNLANMVNRMRELDVDTKDFSKLTQDSTEWKKLQKSQQYQDQVTKLKSFVVKECEEHESLISNLTK